MDWRIVTLVFLGSGAGGVLRYLASGWTTIQGFPSGTLVVNVVGSFLLAVLLVGGTAGGWLTGASNAALGVGLLGGFTTMSAFSFETLKLLEDGDPAKAGLNVVLTLVLCLGAAWLGWVVARGLWPTGS